VSILTILTLAAAALVVLVLVVYLVGIALYLWRANRHLAKLAGGLQAVRGHDRHLEGVGRVLTRD
jgi:predicted membrane channel-forming protein YqfA (hemolysin III family)